MSKPTKRDRKGQFKRGTAPGPGRPTALTEAAYLTAVREACTPADLARVVRRLLALAAPTGRKAKCDIRAAEALLKYLLPPPPKPEDPNSAENRPVMPLLLTVVNSREEAKTSMAFQEWQEQMQKQHPEAWEQFHAWRTERHEREQAERERQHTRNGHRRA